MFARDGKTPKPRRDKSSFQIGVNGQPHAALAAVGGAFGSLFLSPTKENRKKR